MILFIDDEPKKMESYIEEIKLSKIKNTTTNYVVKFISNIDEALDYWNNQQKNIDLLILDVMMPVGDYLNISSAQDGLRTGICFYEKIRKENSEIPIIIFTNVPEQSEILKNKKLNEDCNNHITLFLQKENYLPFQLMEEISKFIPEK